LKPTKAKTFIPKVANDTGVSEDAVAAVIGFYWQEVRKSLSCLKHPRIHLTNLGDFVIKHWKIDEKIEKLERFEEYNRQKGLQQMTARFKTVETLFDLKALKQIIEEEKQRAEFIKLHKTKTHVSKGERNQTLEDQGSDTGGDN
jgi:nucleoid DNA-binding protein